MNIEYRPFRDFEGYRFGNDGSHWTCKLTGPKGGFSLTWKPKKCSLVSVGYLQIELYKNNHKFYFYIHRIILEIFHGPCPEGMEAMHLDGNPQNNDFRNLQWGSHAENESHKFVHGTHRKGSRHPLAKLNESDIIEIRRLKKTKITNREIAKLFKISEGNISEIVNNKIWTHVV